LSVLNGRVVEQSPKSGDPTEVPFPEFLRDHLRTRRLAAGNNGYVFRSVVGTVIRHSNFSRRVWQPAVQEAGNDCPVRIHDLRGTAASWLVHHGVNVMELARVLGPSDPSITLKR
jgi:integrase